MGFRGGLASIEPACNAGDLGSVPFPGEGNVNPLQWIPVGIHSSILAGESHGERSPTGYSSWGCKESDMTE